MPCDAEEFRVAGPVGNYGQGSLRATSNAREVASEERATHPFAKVSCGCPPVRSVELPAVCSMFLSKPSSVASGEVNTRFINGATESVTCHILESVSLDSPAIASICRTSEPVMLSPFANCAARLRAASRGLLIQHGNGAKAYANHAKSEDLVPCEPRHSIHNARVRSSAFAGRQVAETTRRPREGKGKSTV